MVAQKVVEHQAVHDVPVLVAILVLCLLCPSIDVAGQLILSEADLFACSLHQVSALRHDLQANFHVTSSQNQGSPAYVVVQFPHTASSHPRSFFCTHRAG